MQPSNLQKAPAAPADEQDLPEARYAELYRLAPICYLTLDSSGTIVEGNAAAAELLGADAVEALAGVPLIGYLAPISRITFRATLDAAFEEGRMHCCDLRLAAGTLPLRHLRLQAARFGSGGECGVVLFDLAPSCASPPVVERPAGRLESVLDGMPIACLLLDRDFLVADWNRAAQSIFGFHREEVVGRSPYETIVPAACRDRLEEVEAALRREGAPVVHCSRNLDRDGRELDCEWHNTAIRDGQGEIAWFVCLALDITERLKSQAALKRSEQIQQQLIRHLARTRQLMEAALNARIASETALFAKEQELNKVNNELRGILDAVEEGLILYSRDLEIVWSNREACKYFPAADAPHPALSPDYVRDCFRSAAPFADQFSRGGGQILDILVYPIFDEEGVVQSVLEVVRDVTVKTHQQAEVVRTAHLASLGELAAGVAHEINNPIHGIMNYAELLARRFPAEERVGDICGRIVKESERVAHIVRALLDFSRKGDGGKVGVRIEEVVDGALILCRSQLKTDNIALCWDRGEIGLLEVLADPQQIVQVVLNLIGNARDSLNDKYPDADPDKRIEFSLATLEKGGRNWARVSVLDRGGGIPESHLPKVLNPFFSTKGNGRGTGLGLSICNTIIADHQGMLEIESQEGESTTASFLLPVWRTHAG